MGVIPRWISAGAHRVEVMMNAAVVGKPMPRIMQHTIVRIMVGSLAPPETLSKMEVNFKPRPVLVSTPIISPATEQAIATDSMSLALPSSASNTF